MAEAILRLFPHMCAYTTHIPPPIICLWGCLKVVGHWGTLSGKSYSRKPEFVSNLMTPSSTHPVKPFTFYPVERLSLCPPVVQCKNDVSYAVLLCFIPPPDTVSFSTHTVKEALLIGADSVIKRLLSHFRYWPVVSVKLGKYWEILFPNFVSKFLQEVKLI